LKTDQSDVVPDSRQGQTDDSLPLKSYRTPHIPSSRSRDPAILVSEMLIALVARALTLATYPRFSFIVWKLAEQEPRAAGRLGFRMPSAWLTTYGVV
jgi:hypothetical protein